MAAIGMIAGAAIGYAGQQSANRQSARNASQQGYVDTTTHRDPYAGTNAYRDATLQAAFQATFPGNAPGARPAGYQPDPRTYDGRPIGPATVYSPGGDPNPQGQSGTGGTQTGSGAGGATRAKPPAGYRYNAAGRLVRVKSPTGGTGAGAGADAGDRRFDGMSQETADIRNRMANELPSQNARLYGAGEDYVEDTLAGDSRNPLIGRATTAADDISEDPRLSAFQDYLLGEIGVNGYSNASSSGNSGPRVTYNVNPNYAAAGPGGVVPPAVYGSQTGAAEALRKLIAGELPQGWQGAEDAISRRVSEERAANIRDLRARAVGSGFYGGDVYRDLEEGAIARGDRELADQLSEARYAAFQNALSEGANYDLGMANIAANERSAGSASAAASGAAANELASRERLAKMGMLNDALSLGEQGRFGRASQLGDLAGLVSGDQRTALGGVGDITGSRRDDLTAAGTLSLGADRNRTDWQSSQNSLSASRAATSLGRAQLALDRDRYGFQREQYYDPLNRLGTFADVMNGLYGGYGSETTTGRDTRNYSPPAFSSPYGAALSGAAVGGQIGSQYGKRYSGTGA